MMDKYGEKLAEWYISDTRDNFIVNFYTSDLVKCRQIITMIVGQLKNLESEEK